MRRRYEESWERCLASGRAPANRAKLAGHAIQVFTPNFELPQGLCLFRFYHVFSIHCCWSALWISSSANPA
jgi:hypothetical protein